MSAEPLPLETLIESVADGRPVDWAAHTADVDARQRRVLNHLHLVASIAELHRTLGTHEASREPATQACVPGPDIAVWGHLVLLERIGQGAFGEVFRARDSWLDHEVAVKLLKPGGSQLMASSRIIDEARALARVRHPNVVCVHGADIHDGRAGLWMELVRGRTLAQLVAANGLFGAREAVGVGQDLCRALAAVHAEHLVHRDVKAQNVMRAAGGRIVLMDFGAGHTPLYLAPEVLAGGPATVASDIYALGVLLYFLVTNRYPVRGATVEELRERHDRGERHRLADERPDLSAEFVATVERALDPVPLRRYESAGAMLEALSRSVAVPVAAESGPSIAQPQSHRPWRMVAAASLAALVLLAAAAAFVSWRRPAAPASTESQAGVVNGSPPIVAIMPLEGGDGETGYFADGMTEALMQALSGLRTIRIVSRTSVDRALTMAQTAPEIARLLHASAILEGSLHRDDKQVRVNLRLIHAGSDSAVWSRSFAEPLGSILALQQRIAEAVAAEWASPTASSDSKVTECLRRSDGVVLNVPSTRQQVNPAAYDAYLRGRYEYRRQTPAGSRAALEHFQEAARIDPAFARAQLGMAQSYLSLGGEASELPQGDSARTARERINRALQLDGNLPEAHATLGTLQFEVDWNFAAAEASFVRAIALDPSLAAARESYSMFLTSRGRIDEALEQLAAARLVDPFSASVANLTAQAYYFGRQYDRALAEAETALLLDPAATGARVGIARTLSAMGRYDEAIQQYERVDQASSPGHPFFESEIAQAELALGQRARALARLSALERQIGEPGSRVGPHMLAHVTARVDQDAAFRWLDQAFERRSPQVLWLRVDPRFDPLRTDPRFDAFMKRLGLP
jgi:TolB-like protein/Tfp pilus assembly protein PilF/tRNA A-37 threonylcarbamoyl transferase component Bud32